MVNMGDNTDSAIQENIKKETLKETQNAEKFLEQKREIDEKTKEEMKKIIQELKNKMVEIDNIMLNLKNKDTNSQESPQKIRRRLTEIKVPSLELLK